jgi:hypothetical protein
VKQAGPEQREKETSPAPASADEAMLDEWLSLVAGVARRLTKEDLRRHNSGDSTDREARL